MRGKGRWREERIEVTDLVWNGTPCWRWLGSHRHGRPVLNQKYVYRITYERERGPLPEGCEPHHGCEHGWCINPWHVEPLTHKEHMKVHGNPRESSKTHCKAGHPFDEANTYRRGNKRFCRACNRTFVAASKERRQHVRELRA